MIEERSISGKRVLFFAPQFFGYDKKIAEKMEQLGADVDFFDERSIKKSYQKAVLKYAPWMFLIHSYGYYGDIVENTKENRYDYIFVIKGEMIPSAILRRLKELNPSAVFCLYLYDSVRNIPGVKRKFKYFDRILSFDRKDTLRYPGMKFRPLFFVDEFRKEARADIPEKQSGEDKEGYDVSFIGTIHSDRLAVIKRMKEYCTKHRLSFYSFCYLPSHSAYYFYKAINRSFRGVEESDFVFHQLSSEKIVEVVERSSAVLDIQHPRQTGLTMRTIEMLGMNKKLITTNPDIVHYDFFHPQNIAIIGREDISIPPDFFKSKPEPIDTGILESYSLEHWIMDILCKVGGCYYEK